MNKITFESDFNAEALRKTASFINDMALIVEAGLNNTTTITSIGDLDNEDDLTIDENDIQTETTVDVDSDGLPWDVRIHSANKSKLVKNKLWKKKRGVDDELVITVEAELRSAMAAGVTIEDEAPPPGATEETIAPAPPAAVLTMEESTYKCVDGSVHLGQVLIDAGWTVEQIEALEKLPMQSESTIAVTFPELMILITPALTAKTIAESDIIAAVNAVGLASLTLLAARPDLVGQVKTALFG